MRFEPRSSGNVFPSSTLRVFPPLIGTQTLSHLEMKASILSKEDREPGPKEDQPGDPDSAENRAQRQQQSSLPIGAAGALVEIARFGRAPPRRGLGKLDHFEAGQKDLRRLRARISRSRGL